MVFVAFPLLAVTLTKNPVLIAMVAVAEQLPWLLFSLPAGALADRVNRLLVFGVGIIAGYHSLVALYLAAFLVGTCETAFWAATSAALPALVEREVLPRANGYLLAADTAGEQFAGPAAGGILFGWFQAAPFLADAVSFVASAVLLVRSVPPSPRRIDEEGRTGLARDVALGLSWFAGNRLVRLLAGIVAAFAFCQAIVIGVLVLYGTRVLHLDKPAYGVFLAVGALGNVAGGLLAGRIHARLGARWSIVGAGLLAAAGYVALGKTSMVAVAAAGIAIQAVAVSVGNVATLSLRQSLIPPEMLGRVNNVFRMCVWGIMPLGALVGGALASGVGLHTTFLVAGLLQAGVLLLVFGRLNAWMPAEPPSRRAGHSLITR
jgi:MFS family permease